ncbi:MAG: hypothetical protein NVS2B4_01430 [Ramlibacter sp.]
MKILPTLSAARRSLLGTVPAAVLFTFAGTWASRTHAQTASAKPNRLLLQVSDGEPQKWSLALNNAANVQAEFGAGEVEVEVVAYGPGIGMLRGGSQVAERVAAALKSGVHVVACENTMRGQKLTAVDMLPGIGYVPSGVGELLKKQQKGWAYIRP